MGLFLTYHVVSVSHIFMSMNKVSVSIVHQVLHSQEFILDEYRTPRTKGNSSRNCERGVLHGYRTCIHSIKHRRAILDPWHKSTGKLSLDAGFSADFACVLREELLAYVLDFAFLGLFSLVLMSLRGLL